MSPRKILPSASPAHPTPKHLRTRASRHPRKGNSHTELTKSELEKMMLDAARLRALYAQSDE